MYNDVDFPFELTCQEWNKLKNHARDLMRGNNVQTRCTKNSGSEMMSASRLLDWLDFGIREDLKIKLERVQTGELVLTGFARLRFIYDLERPTTYRDVIRKAKRLGLLVD